MDDLKVWEPSADDELTPGVMNQVVWGIIKGEPKPELSLKLLQKFLDCTPGWTGYGEIPEPIVRLLRSGIEAYLKDPKDGILERALGLRKPQQRPKTQTNRHHQIALGVLRLRLQGETLEAAALALQDTCFMSKSKIQDIWAENKITALEFEAVSRALEAPDRKAHWTPLEIERLKEIYPGYVK